MDDKINPNLPIYRDSLHEYTPRREREHCLFAYLDGTQVRPCTGTELALHGPASPDESILRQTEVGNDTVITRFSPIRLDRLRRIIPSPDGEPLWFETTLQTPTSTTPMSYYETYEGALAGHDRVVRGLEQRVGCVE